MRPAVPGVVVLAGALLTLVGTILPYGACAKCRVLAPPHVPAAIWLPNAVAPLTAVIASVVLALRRWRGAEHTEFSSGFITGVGLMTVALFLVWGIHVRFPGGGTFGAGGLTGVAGGVLIVIGGLLFSRKRDALQHSDSAVP